MCVCCDLFGAVNLQGGHWWRRHTGQARAICIWVREKKAQRHLGRKRQVGRQGSGFDYLSPKQRNSEHRTELLTYILKLCLQEFRATCFGDRLRAGRGGSWGQGARDEAACFHGACLPRLSVPSRCELCWEQRCFLLCTICHLHTR